MTTPQSRAPAIAETITPELTPDRLIAEALKAGALAPSDIVHHRVVVDLIGRSHVVYRISVDGVPRFYVKVFGPNRGATDGLAARERLVLSLARERPAVAALVPPEWPWSGAGALADNVVATAAVSGKEAWALDRPGGGELEIGAAWTTLITGLARPLAAFHRATRDLAQPGAGVPAPIAPREPWGLCLMDGDAAPELWATPVTSALLREAALDSELVAGLRAARAMWRPMALIHADLKHDNILLSASDGAVTAKILDWEMARVGDLAWDLAGICARLAALSENAPPWPEASLDRVAALVAAYAVESGLPRPALARRLMHYAAAVLLMMALQHGSSLEAGADLNGAKTLVMKSRSTFRRADELTQSVLARMA